MIVHVYTMVHNEEALMPYFLRHYGRFASKITVLDNESDDRTAEIARAGGAEVIPIDTGGRHRVRVLRREMNTRYQKSRGNADWVICAEGDEFLWHPDLLRVLKDYWKQGITLPKIQGFDMVADLPPTSPGQIYDEIKHGFPSETYAKRAVFNPMLDINFSPGGHTVVPWGPVVESAAAEIKLLHYRYLGEEYFVRRYEQHRRRTCEENILNDWGTECLRDQRKRYARELDIAAPKVLQVVP